MRIAMITEAWDPIWGGGQAHIWNLAQELAKRHGCEVDIFTMNLLKNPVQTQHDTTLGVRVLPVGNQKNFFSFFDRVIWNIEIIFSLKKQHSLTPYSILHAHSTLPGIPAKILGLLLKIPVVYTVHGANFLDLGKKNVFFFLEKFLFTQIRYDLEISVTKSFLKYKNRNQPIVIPNGVERERFAPILPLPSEKKGFRILFVGRLDKVKGVDVLLSALSPIKEQLLQQRVNVRIVGYGYEEERFKKLCQELDLDALVTFTGKLEGPALVAEYHAADLFILPSLSEGSPLTVLEAWAASVPVLVTDVGDNRDLVTPQEDGFIVPPANKEALAAGILEALHSPHLHQMGGNGFVKVKKGYTWEAIAQKIYVAYKAAIEES